MRNDLAAALEEAVHAAVGSLEEITDAEAAKKAAGQWSKKEELGHLIDSAANNHIRFMRATLEADFRGVGYAQDDWVRLHGYEEVPWLEIIDFWQRYNALLARVVRRIPEERLGALCVIGDSPQVTLQFLIEDYVFHMQHHLDHILERETVTQYPGAALGV
jgi:CTP:molybdopterin cytidylyltransferase MocA